MMGLEKVEFGGIAIINCISKTSNSWVLKMQPRVSQVFLQQVDAKIVF